MKKITIYIMLAMLCFSIGVRGQELAEIIKPLKVGDRVPAIFWQLKHTVYQNGKTTEQDLSAYKGKLLILDFWATWCGPCLSAFPKLESYKQKFTDRLAVVLVSSVNTQDREERVDGLLLGKAKNLQSIRRDSILLKFFPHVAIPHYIWIADGSVRAITTAEWLTETNVVITLNASERLNSVQTIKNKP